MQTKSLVNVINTLRGTAGKSFISKKECVWRKHYSQAIINASAIWLSLLQKICKVPISFGLEMKTDFFIVDCLQQITNEAMVHGKRMRHYVYKNSDFKEQRAIHFRRSLLAILLQTNKNCKKAIFLCSRSQIWFMFFFYWFHLKKNKRPQHLNIPLELKIFLWRHFPLV